MIGLVKSLYYQRSLSTQPNSEVLKSVKRIAVRMPKGLSDNNSMEFERAFNRLMNPERKHQVYTTSELQTAISENLFSGLTYEICQKQYGIPVASLKRHINMLVSQFDCLSRKDLISFSSSNLENEILLRTAIKNYKKPITGTTPLLDQTEIDLLFLVADKRNSCGINQGRAVIGETGSDLCKMKAESLIDCPMKEKLNKA